MSQRKASLPSQITKYLLMVFCLLLLLYIYVFLTPIPMFKSYNKITHTNIDSTVPTRQLTPRNCGKSRTTSRRMSNQIKMCCCLWSNTWAGPACPSIHVCFYHAWRQRASHWVAQPVWIPAMSCHRSWSPSTRKRPASWSRSLGRCSRRVSTYAPGSMTMQPG